MSILLHEIQPFLSQENQQHCHLQLILLLKRIINDMIIHIVLIIQVNFIVRFDDNVHHPNYIIVTQHFKQANYET